MVATGPSALDRSLALMSLFASLLSISVASAAELDLPPGLSGGGDITQAYATEGYVDDGRLLATPNAQPLGAEGVVMGGGPMSVSSGGSYFNPTLGSHIRARYNTRSYGQEDGNLDLGTMGLWEMADGFGFFDGQVTLNDEQNVGYNLGLGYRWLTLPVFPNSVDSQKIAGVSIWADGQGVDAQNFFPQVGVSLELLGDRIDLRANGYIPVGPSHRDRDFVPVTGSLEYTQNFIALSTLGIRDTPLTVGEVEAAGRIADLDAWLFGGVYAFDGGPYSEVGGKIGLRGYATHDLLLSIAITNDDLFDTNAIFSATWFIGRTRSNNCPSGVLEDRFREPVLRNDYVAMHTGQVSGSGDALTDTNGDLIRMVHVNSSAAAGGDGTFENPLNALDTIKANSLENDIVLVTSGSDFSGQMAMLQDGQRFIGEGGGNAFSIGTTQFGTIDLPETSTGASAGAAPIIRDAAAQAVLLADGNTVSNFNFINNATAVGSDATNGSVGAILNQLTIAGSTVAALDFDTTDGVYDIQNTTITGGTGPAVRVVDTIGGSIQMGATTSITDVAGNAVEIDNNDGTVVIGSDITTTGVSGGTVSINNNKDTVQVSGDIQSNNASALLVTSSDAQITTSGAISSTGTGDTVSITDAGDGVATSAAISINGTVSNDAGGSVVVINGGDDAITFNDDVTDAGTGISITDRDAGQVRFTAATDIDTQAGATQAVLINNNNASSQVAFTGGLSITAAGTTNGFIAGAIGMDPGSVTVAGTGVTNEITTADGRTLEIIGGTSTGGVNFNTVTSTNGSANTINVDAFAGQVNIDGGSVTTNGVSVRARDTSIDLDGVDLENTAAGTVADIDFSTNTTARTVRIANGDLNGGDIDIDSASTAGGIVTLDTLNTGGGIGAISLDTTAAASGNVSVVGNNLTMAGAATADIAGAGNGSVTLTDVTGITGGVYNSTGDGNVTASYTRVTGTGNVLVATTGEGNGTLTATQLNTGGTVSVSSAAGQNSDLTVNMNNSGNTTAFGAITVNDLGTGSVSATFNNSSASSIDFDSAQTGAATLAVNDGAYTGNITADAIGTGNFNASVTNGTQITNGRIRFNGINAGSVDYEVTGLTYTNAAASTLPALDLVLGGSVTTADVTVSNNTISQGLDGNAFSLDINAGSSVDFQLSGNTFTNDNVTDQTALIDVGSNTTLNATISNNLFTNINVGGPEFLLDNSGVSTTRLALSGNGDTSAAMIFNNDNGASNFQVRGVNAVGVDAANDANVTFDTDTTFDPTLVVPTP
ncbi:beta strand repeat-containing protein [Botrimarina hoheduenensis]|uniref:Inverse autotransporter beta-domain domain-containing protein n=1 Tax=Botrimarina hoheduenensis TaxID=2528000 RepID=A0A5C5WCN8_9BACT|nr:hypothetical protein [Botrimarina hoheduenensis]TWT48688.1 hypothetical protein Pla111_04630 [Botrimarina hoheduenensis]